MDLILFQALKTNMHGVQSFYNSHVSNTTLKLRIWINNMWENQTFQSFINQSEFIAKQDPYTARLAFETGAKCQDFVARYKDDGIPCEIDSPFCCAKTTMTVRQAKSFEDRRSESNLRLGGG